MSATVPPLPNPFRGVFVALLIEAIVVGLILWAVFVL